MNIPGRKPKKDNKAATFRVSPETLGCLDAYSARTGISKSFVVEAALREYFDNRAVDAAYNNLEGATANGE